MTGDAPEADENQSNDPTDPARPTGHGGAVDPNETLPLAVAPMTPMSPMPPPPPPIGASGAGDTSPPPPPGFPPPAEATRIDPVAADPTLAAPVAGQAPPPAEEPPVEPVPAPAEAPPATAVVPVVPADDLNGGAGTHGGAAPPSGRRGQRAVRPPKPGLPAAVVALAVGLLASAVAQSAIRTRSDGEIDWSNYSVGLAATAALLLTALGATIAIRTSRNPIGREELVTWPGVLGILGAAAMVGVAMDTPDQHQNVAYVVGGLLVLLGLIGYVIIVRPAFMVTVVLGLVVLYGKLFDEVADDIGDEDTGVMVAIGAIAIFVVVVTLLGWLLPSRAVTGVVVGFGAVIAFTSVLAYLAVVQAFAEFFGEMTFEVDPTAAPAPPPDDSMMGLGYGAKVDDEVWTILGVAGLLVVVWAIAAARTGHSGFTILAILMPVAVVPLATFVLAVESPTWWGATVAAVGGVILLTVAVQQRFVRRDLTVAT